MSATGAKKPIPRDEFEQLLSQAWAEVLGLAEVGIYDDFFDLGGSSLLAVQLLVSVQKLIPGEPIPLSALMEAPTVERFAAWMRSGQGSRWQSLVRLRPGSARRPPLICVHAAGGNVLTFRPVAMALPDDLPVYCFQAKGLDGSEPFYTVEETARYYVDELHNLQPHGPYYLCGNCYGGFVAFEMARLLEERGEKVGLLAIIDTYNFAFGQFLSVPEVLWRNAVHYARRFALHLRQLGSQRPSQWVSYIGGRFHAARTQFWQLLRMKFGSGKSQYPTNLPGLDLGEAAGTPLGVVLNRVNQASVQAAAAFVPKPFGGRAIIFRASVRRVEPYQDDYLGWRPVVLGGIEAFEIEGVHDNMNASSIGAILNAKLLEISGDGKASAVDELKELLRRQDVGFFGALREHTLASSSCDEVLQLSSLRKQAAQRGLTQSHKTVRIAILSGYTVFPLHELIAHFLSIAHPTSWKVEFFLGDYDNYFAEIMEESSRLYDFKPEIILLIASHRRCQYTGQWFDAREQQEAGCRNTAAQILQLCRVANGRSGAELILANFPLPARFDPGPYRARTLASDWTFRKAVNMELGLGAPPYVHLCDVEFLSARRGTLDAWDAHAWFESKQPYGSELMLDVAREVSYLVTTLRESPKKVAVLDLDNTLWGGVIGDDGLEGIEIGDTSPRGEAYKAFQHYLLGLSQRGVLLAVCSKNDRDKAVEPFEKHPEMVLRMKDFAAFKANWQPKSDNIREIAIELNLGLDSFVFVDDNPAEIDLVRQFVPEVTTILLGSDPSDYVAVLQDSRCFEPKSVTAEDVERVSQYRQEAERHELLATATDMNAYLQSLAMEAAIREFREVDVPRIAQLINKSNQFNLTTRRRSEAQVQADLGDPAHIHFTVRLADRFGDYGLISVVIGKIEGETLEIDTWVMSCRVLKRQVEEEVLNEIVRLARLRECSRIRGVYLPTAKNGMVRDLYPTLGFTAPPAEETTGRLEFMLDPHSFVPRPTGIRILEHARGPKLALGQSA